MVMCGETVSVLAYGSSLHLYIRPFVSLAVCTSVRPCSRHAAAQDTPVPSLLLPAFSPTCSFVHLFFKLLDFSFPTPDLPVCSPAFSPTCFFGPPILSTARFLVSYLSAYLPPCYLFPFVSSSFQNFHFRHFSTSSSYLPSYLCPVTCAYACHFPRLLTCVFAYVFISYTLYTLLTFPPYSLPYLLSLFFLF